MFSLLAMALPLQSMAAVAMVDCMAPATAAASAHPSVHEAHHVDDADIAADVAPTGQTCASCGVTAVLPSSVAAADVTFVPVSFKPTTRPGVPPFLTDGPDRPPRTDLD